MRGEEGYEKGDARGLASAGVLQIPAMTCSRAGRTLSWLFLFLRSTIFHHFFRPERRRVEMTGFEPVTSALQTRRSPTELHPREAASGMRVLGFEPRTSALSELRSSQLSYTRLVTSERKQKGQTARVWPYPPRLCGIERDHTPLHLLPYFHGVTVSTSMGPWYLSRGNLPSPPDGSAKGIIGAPDRLSTGNQAFRAGCQVVGQGCSSPGVGSPSWFRDPTLGEDDCRAMASMHAPTTPSVAGPADLGRIERPCPAASGREKLFPRRNGSL